MERNSAGIIGDDVRHDNPYLGSRYASGSIAIKVILKIVSSSREGKENDNGRLTRLFSLVKLLMKETLIELPKPNYHLVSHYQ